MIVDASVAFKWLVDEDDSDTAIAWLQHDDLNAPALIVAEVGNAMTRSIRRRELESSGVNEQFERLPKLLTLLDNSPYAARAFELSIELRHSFYDCVYLAASEALGKSLLTADQVFASKLADHPLGHLVTVLGRHG